jgi:AcrR family transcriptional regulator
MDDPIRLANLQRAIKASHAGEKVMRARGRPKVRSDEDQRALITACAFELFMSRGYAATSTNDIAAECHISKRTFYRLFPSKIDLFAALVAHHRRSMMSFPPVVADIPMDEQLASVFQVDIDRDSDLRRAEFIRMAISESRQFPELGQLIRSEGADKTREELAAWLDQGKAMGLLCIGDSLLTAGILMDLVFGAAALKSGLNDQWPGGTDRPAFIRQCIGYVVNGMRPR